MAKAYPGCRSLVQQALQLGEVPASALDICMASITASTFKQYDSGLKLWWQFCKTKSISVFSASIPTILEFLTLQFNRGATYGSLNSYRSAIAQILGPSIAQDFRIQRFFKGICHLRPSRPKYDNTWDPAIVLDHVRGLSNSEISLELLSCKLAMLLALSTGQRVQTLSLIELDNISSSPEGLQIRISKRVKSSSTNRCQPVLSLPFFLDDPNICVASTLLYYIEKTSSLRNPALCNNLLITFKKPHHNATSQSISRWIKRIMRDSGIDTLSFTSHSTRHASTSTAHRKGIPLDIIRSAAGWSGRSTVFATFYKRPLRDSYAFAKAVFSTKKST